MLALAVIRCAPPAIEADPALWKAEGPNGETAWLFGTIHAAERPFDWRTEAVEAALAASDELVVEVADMDEQALAGHFATLSKAPGLPPLIDRVPAAEQSVLAAKLAELDMDRASFSGVETWAAALTLARARTDAADPAYGIDRALIDAVAGKPVRELEGADTQLRIFDALPEPEQLDLLNAVLDDADTGEGRLAEMWARGDMDAIARQTDRGLLADPELRQALLTGRNRDWVTRIEQRLRSGHRPFVAVGAAHLAGADGLPALLEAKGYTVTRVR